MTSIRLSQALSRSSTATKPSELLRRWVSVSVAAIGLLLTAPLMAAIALGIKLTSRGPVFFKQTRIGFDRRAGKQSLDPNRRATDCGGKPFMIYKFRTMSSNGNGHSSNGAGSQQVWAQPNDPRVTRIGRLLRLYRLDELPQLLNVLIGDMDIVGPRPEQPAIFQRLRTQIDRYQERQRVRPGITGWAQINLNYDTSVESVRTKVSYDLEYVERQSVLEDVRIMLWTVPVVVFKRGAW